MLYARIYRHIAPLMHFQASLRRQMHARVPGHFKHRLTSQHPSLNGGSGGGGSGGGRGIKSTGSNDGSGGNKNSSGLGALWLGYAKLLETSPLATKVVTSAALNGSGDILGQLLFEKDKPFDWLRFAKFVFLGGALVAPILHVWYGLLPRLVPAAGMAGTLGRLALDQLCFAPVFVSTFISALMVLDGTPEKIQPKLRQDLKDAIFTNWKIWVPGNFINFQFVPPNYQVLFANFIALVWNTYLSWAANKDVQMLPLPSPTK